MSSIFNLPVRYILYIIVHVTNKLKKILKDAVASCLYFPQSPALILPLLEN